MNQIIYVGKHLLTFSVARHSHSSWELIYCTSGNGELAYDGGSIPYGEGDIVIVPPFVPHSNLSDSGFTNIHMNILDLSLPTDHPLLLRDEGNRLILNAFSGAFFLFSMERGRQTPLLAAYGNLVACHLLELKDTPSYSKVVDEISNVIVNNYPDCDFELDAYLHSLPFSYDYVRKLFKKELGVTPHRYLSDMRLQVAAQYLSLRDQGGRNVAEIARLCGYREPLYFSRMFKKKYGVSPSAYSLSATAPETPDSDSMKIML